MDSRVARGFDEQTCYYDFNGQPVAVWPDWDYAEDWSAYPIREVHPFHPILNGKEVTEEEFRTTVKAIHGIG